MSSSYESFAQTTLSNARRRALSAGIERSLSIAVLGPAPSDVTGSGGWKRQQIHDALLSLDHKAFFPEERVEPDSLWVEREIEILSAPDVNLVVILQTADSYGAMGELSAFVTHEAIVSKTAVFTPAQYYKPRESFVANAVSHYLAPFRYTQRQFDECSLVDECREFVSDFLAGTSPLVRANEF